MANYRIVVFVIVASSITPMFLLTNGMSMPQDDGSMETTTQQHKREMKQMSNRWHFTTTTTTTARYRRQSRIMEKLHHHHHLEATTERIGTISIATDQHTRPLQNHNNNNNDDDDDISRNDLQRQIDDDDNVVEITDALTMVRNKQMSSTRLLLQKDPLHLSIFKIRRRRNKENPSDNNNSLETRNNSVVTTNTTLLSDTDESKDSIISDKGIIIIVISTSIGLVICLLSAALIVNKCYWSKTREENAGYQGVLQKDTPDGNSPAEEQTSAVTSKDNGIRNQTNMFAQIDEIDEADSCPSSPVVKQQQKNVDGPNGTTEGETKPLLTHSVTTPSCTMDDSRSSESDVLATSDGNVGLSNEKSLEEVDETMTTVDLCAPTTEVRVEVVQSASNSPEPERIYCRTGLSQSDYSISSFTSVNPSYRYGNQVGYMCGYYGYPSMEMTSPDYFYCIADDVMLLPPPPVSGIAFPSQESDLDISVRATKDSEESEEITTSANSHLGLPVDSTATLTMENDGSEFSLVVNADDRPPTADDDDDEHTEAEQLTGNNDNELMVMDTEYLSDSFTEDGSAVGQPPPPPPPVDVDLPVPLEKESTSNAIRRDLPEVAAAAADDAAGKTVVILKDTTGDEVT